MTKVPSITRGHTDHRAHDGAAQGYRRYHHHHPYPHHPHDHGGGGSHHPRHGGGRYDERDHFSRSRSRSPGRHHHPGSGRGGRSRSPPSYHRCGRSADPKGGGSGRHGGYGRSRSRTRSRSRSRSSSRSRSPRRDPALAGATQKHSNQKGKQQLHANMVPDTRDLPVLALLPYTVPSFDGLDSSAAAACAMPTLTCDVLCTYSVRWSHTNPQRTRDIAAHRRILLPPTVSLPRYQAPPLPCALKRKLPPQYMEYAENSVAQLLLASQRCGAPDACYFHVVTQRTCLKKMSMRDESASIAVQRIGGTLFLRSYKSRLRCNLSDIGYQFERACTGGDGQVFDSHYAATDVRVGRFRCLIESEIDAVDGDSGQLIELKSAAKWEGKITKQVNLWCQCMLGGVGRAILGNRDKKTDRIKSIEDLPIETLLTQGMKHKLLERLVRSLEFLDSSVRDDGVYLYHIPRRGPDTLKQLEQKHSFINVEMINAVKDSYT
mmetsp:Transcript_30298/g.40457  ORF Transcript_30298/g.40457 Transcript_30298/m.40457 type:complete len:490 (+) Transcript_30298:201-1670(+)